MLYFKKNTKCEIRYRNLITRMTLLVAADSKIISEKNITQIFHPHYTESANELFQSVHSL